MVGDFMKKKGNVNRRDFLKKGVAVGAAAFGVRILSRSDHLFAQVENNQFPDLVAVRNGEPDVMFEAAMKTMGGMRRYVKKGQTVVVKPNIGWAREPENGADTNPLLVKKVVEHCIEAGAKQVYVFDNSCNNWKECYSLSGISEAAKNAGAKVVPGNSEKYYEEVQIDDAKVLKKTMVHELILESDVFINIPVLKHHSGTKMTAAMKNLMGVVWNRWYYHKSGLDECISDFCLYKKPDLNIIDAYRITTDNGPQRARPEDIILKKMLLMSEDIVAVDTAASKILFPDSDAIEHVRLGFNKNIGNNKLQDLNIKKIAL